MYKVSIPFVVLISLGFGISHANAQAYDLRNLPSNYTFEALLGYRDNAPEKYSVTFLSKSGRIYYFETIADLSGSSTPRTRGAIVNESNLRATVRNINRGRYTPHGCPPLLEPCEYMGLDGAGPFSISRSVQLVGDIWVTDRFFLIDGAREFVDRVCIVYDDFGFWQDFVILDNDFAPRSWAARTLPSSSLPPENRISHIRSICEQRLVS